jgi:hypothetical protein
MILRIDVRESHDIHPIHAEIMKMCYPFIFIITKHYLLTAPLSYGDIQWRDNPLIPVTLKR